jgi:hypothetical protein
MKSAIGCFSFIVAIILFNVFVGAWAVNTILAWFDKDISWVADAVIGLFTAEFTIPIAIVGKILQACGIF